MRKLAETFKPTTEITQSGDEIKIVTHTPKGNKTANFTIDQEQEQTQDQSGDKVKVLVNWDGDKLVENITPLKDGKKSQKVTRSREGDNMLVVIEIGDVVCKRSFKRVQ